MKIPRLRDSGAIHLTGNMPETEATIRHIETSEFFFGQQSNGYTSSIKFVIVVLIHGPCHTKIAKLHHTLSIYQAVTRGNVSEKK